VATIKNGGPTKEILMTRAQDLDISGRSDMTKDELYEQAKATEISGRSSMDKSELVDAIATQEQS